MIMSLHFAAGSMKPALLYIGGTKKTHIGFDDPAAAKGTEDDIMRDFRRVRDEIREKLIAFFQAENNNGGEM